ncbi:MAG: hemerythrin domain-containing protein [Campylobacterales bacterium]
MLINWHDSYSIHNTKIDNQHKKLFELAKKASLMGGKYASREEIREILAEFFEYMKVHFADEEAYMESIDYPLLGDHRELHKHIVKELAATILQIKNVNEMKEKLGVIAQEWLLDHILHHDMLIEKYRMRSILDEKNGTKEQKTHSSIAKEEQQEDSQPTKKQDGYYYSCGCEGKVHAIPKNAHNDIQKKGLSYKCKKCGQTIVYTGHFYFAQ